MSKLLEPEEIRTQVQCMIGRYYDLPEDIQVSHLKYSENFTYLLTSESSKMKYVLRVNRPGYHEKTELESELLWIHALNEDTDIAMADVLPGLDQQLIQTLDLKGTEDTYYCSLFSFVEGEGIRGMEFSRLVTYQEKIGAITAKLHLHSMQWNATRQIKRFTWNLEDLFGAQARWGDWKENSCLSENQKIILQNCVEIGCHRIRKYGQTPQNYGLIHSDLNINNILVDGDVVNVLDYDDCGYGWFLFDLSTAVLEYDDTLEEMIAAWIRGYQTIRTLSREDLEEVDTFVVLRKIVRMGWIASHYDNDTVKRVTDRYYTETVKLAQKYCEKHKGELYDI